MLDIERQFLDAIRKFPDDIVPRLIYADWLEDDGRAATAAAVRGVVKVFGRDFDSPGGALTLDVRDVCEDRTAGGKYHTRSHPDGWTVSGTVWEDYFVWVNDFVADHPELGRVEGNFESLVFATSEEAFQDFYATHPPAAWDYHDI
jgi:uncharacterized protein (TIGR02996 family)